MNQDEYLEKRVDHQMAYYSKASRQAKKKHTRAQVAIISLGLLVPVIVNLDFVGLEDDDTSILRLVVTVLSLALAIISGIANFKKYGELWLNYRLTLESIKREKNFFLTGSEKYHHHQDAFNLFVENIENILSSESRHFKSLIESDKG